MKTMLLLTVLSLATGWVAMADDAPMTCAYYPIDYEPETGLVLFLVDEHPRYNGIVDCGESWGNLAWYVSSFDNWPEYCPDCTSRFEHYAAVQDHPLRRRIPAASTLCSVLPEKITGKNGRSITPRAGISKEVHHDVQIQPPGGGAVVSVRLFEGVADPSRAGAGRSGARTILIGFETDRLSDDTIGPLRAESVKGRQHVVTVTYLGKRFPVLLTKSPTQSTVAARR